MSGGTSDRPHHYTISVEGKRHLTAGWPPELSAIEFAPVTAGGQAESSAGGREALINHAGIRPATSLADAKSIVIILAAAGLAQQAHHMSGPLRHVRVKPFGEYLLEFMGQPQKDPGGMNRPGIRGPAED